VSGFGHCPQSGLPDRYQRDFSGRKECVDRDEKDNYENAKWGIKHADKIFRTARITKRGDDRLFQ